MASIVVVVLVCGRSVAYNSNTCAGRALIRSDHETLGILYMLIMLPYYTCMLGTCRCIPPVVCFGISLVHMVHPTE